MPKSIPDIIYLKTKNNVFVDSPVSTYRIPFFKDAEYFSNWESYTQFVKEVEKVVRHNDRYNKYIYYLKNEVKLNHCQVLSRLDDEDCTIEMHHGPIFNLYDYCEIMLEYYLLRGWNITTFKVADSILREHEKNHIQVVMLSTTVHQEVHARDIFINYRHAYGDLNAFIKKYGIALTDDHKEKLNRYIDKSIMIDSNDYGLLTLNRYLYVKNN